ncbi:TonB-dependent receptor plug domain-containing protein [Hyunsoonleella aestuarii]|uniref:TonB-dependent receptor plug domain-containing protein n=1 Tax=Hyunsoonleella aestuarii TaxID=912802 RepID=A0ABP8EAQ7_9FLAO|nr:TonB-dependent receptor plug domain-containing protein [Hyunsoonleella aestuarii]
MKSLLTILFIVFSFNSLITQNNESKIFELKGSIKDYDGSPIKGVRIFVDSLKTKSKTDKHGAYSVKITNEAKLITAYSEKYGLIDIEYNNEDRIDFIFPKDKEIISKKRFSEMGFGYSVYNNNSIDYSSYTDIFQLLRTKFPNVRVIGQEIRVIGAGKSLSNGSDFFIKPLYIVNGTQVSNIASISPADIKHISVERVNSSLYGSRGAGGVIKIKLK